MAHLSAIRSWRDATYFLETPGMDEGYDAINVAPGARLAAGPAARAACRRGR